MFRRTLHDYHDLTFTIQTMAATAPNMEEAAQITAAPVMWVA
jgi:hypothetical protein